MRSPTSTARRDPGYAEHEARVAWDRAIDVWEDFQERGLDYARDVVHGPALIRALGDIRGLRLLDVGCGQGRFTRELARRGASVTGIDWSVRMLQAARRHERESPLGIRYRRLDARAIGSGWPAGSFDQVVACMSLMDMPGLTRVLRGAYRVLRVDGRLVFSVSHPFNTAEVGWERLSQPVRGTAAISRYFVERVGVTEWRMKRLTRPFDTLYWHRTFETWFRLLSSAGFSIEQLTEPRATSAEARANRVLRGSQGFPFFLVIACHKRAGARTSSGARPRN